MKTDIVLGVGDKTFHIVEVFIANDGIGPYEYWGAKCYDSGTDYVEEFIADNISEDELSDELYEIVCDVLINILWELYDDSSSDT
jgi:hypothetical protein